MESLSQEEKTSYQKYLASFGGAIMFPKNWSEVQSILDSLKGGGM
jgi:hypothetical protein